MSLQAFIDHPWIDRQLATMTLTQKVGQMLHPALNPKATAEELETTLGECQPGGAFLFPGTQDDFRRAAAWLQQRNPSPVIVSSDLENGAGRMIQDATIFPDLMAVAAVNDRELAQTMGTAAAIEGRASGVHWSFGPVVDINTNIHNPITNTRSLGDDPDVIQALATAIIRGMQNNGLAATAKHFPGDGMDDRDQHLCTSVNSRSREDWFATSGRMFKAAIDAGVWTIMTGHISCPALDPGEHGEAPPATLSTILTTDILRGELGFEGVIITDAMQMGGVTSWGTGNENLVRTVAAGSDMILFSRIDRDLPALCAAVEDGRLSEHRIDESVRRILALKVALGLHESTGPRAADPALIPEFHAARDAIAERAITVWRDQQGVLEAGIAPGSKVLVYHMVGCPAYNVNDLDDRGRAEGWQIVAINEETLAQMPPAEDFDYVLVTSVFGPNWGTGRIRWGGLHMRPFMDLFSACPEKLIVVSFGSPYHLYEMPRLPCYLNAYSPDAATQKAVIQVLTGRKRATGRSPVTIPGVQQAD